MSDDKTEEPSEKKIQDSRRQGQVWKSRDLSGLVAFAIAMAVVKASWQDFEATFTHLFHYSVDHIAHPEEITTAALQLTIMSLVAMLTLCAPIAFAAGISGSMLDFLQVGSLFAFEVLMPKFDKLNPLAGLKNMVSPAKLVEMLKSMLKLSITGYVVYGVVHDAMGIVVATIHGDAQTTMQVMGELVGQIVNKVVLIYLAFSIFDVWWQRRQFMKNLMMSKEDVKKEYKESEGDPHHKAHRKQMHHEIMEGAQMEAVKDADVVVTNPDHVAVALKYRAGRDSAPMVVAKGTDEVARSIKELAKEHQVPLLRNVPLAHALLRTEVNDSVPEALFDAVAEVLCFVYQLDAVASAAGRPQAAKLSTP